MDPHHRKDINIRDLRTDHALCHLIWDLMLPKPTVTYFDYILCVGDKQVKDFANATSHNLMMDHKEHALLLLLNFKLANLNVAPPNWKCRNLVTSISCSLTKKTPNSLTSVVSELYRCAYQKRDLMACIKWCTWLSSSSSSSVANVVTQLRDIMNRTNRTVNGHRVSIPFSKLSLTSLRFISFADESFAANQDLTSQHGYIILLSDGTANLMSAQSSYY